MRGAHIESDNDSAALRSSLVSFSSFYDSMVHDYY